STSTAARSSPPYRSFALPPPKYLHRRKVVTALPPFCPFPQLLPLSSFFHARFILRSEPMLPYVTAEHDALRRQVREFAEAEIAPVAREHDEQSRFPWDNVRRMADLGLFGVNVPREFGGMGRDYISYMLVIEELARIDVSHSITVSAHSTLGTSPILN